MLQVLAIEAAFILLLGQQEKQKCGRCFHGFLPYVSFWGCPVLLLLLLPHLLCQYYIYRHMGITFFLGTQNTYFWILVLNYCLFVIIFYSPLFAVLIAPFFFNLEDSENYKRKQDMIGKCCNTVSKGCCSESKMTHYCRVPLRLVGFTISEDFCWKCKLR